MCTNKMNSHRLTNTLNLGNSWAHSNSHGLKIVILFGSVNLSFSQTHTHEDPRLVQIITECNRESIRVCVCVRLIIWRLRHMRFDIAFFSIFRSFLDLFRHDGIFFSMYMPCTEQSQKENLHLFSSNIIMFEFLFLCCASKVLPLRAGACRVHQWISVYLPLWRNMCIPPFIYLFIFWMQTREISKAWWSSNKQQHHINLNAIFFKCTFVDGFMFCWEKL